MIDPNETWGQFLKSMLLFDEPKTVPVDSLPEGYDPAKKPLNSLKTLVNWRGQNYIEEFKTADEEQEDVSIHGDIERNGECDVQSRDVVRDIEIVQLNNERSEQEFCDTV